MKLNSPRAVLVFALLWLGAGLVMGWALADLLDPDDSRQDQGNREQIRRLVEEFHLDRAQQRDLATAIKVINRQVEEMKSRPEHLNPDARKKIRETKARLDYIIQNSILTPDQLRRYKALLGAGGVGTGPR